MIRRKLEGTMRTVTMVMAERGTDWWSWIDALRTGASDVVVVVQRENESRESFQERVHQRVIELQQDGASVRIRTGQSLPLRSAAA